MSSTRVSSTPSRRRRAALLALALVTLLALEHGGLAVAMVSGDGVMITEGDLEALVAVKEALQDTRGALRSWNRSSSQGACQGKWEGIKCAQGQVIVLQLVGKGLSGTLSPQVSQLFSLRKLSLHHNAIYGAIPASLASLGSLRGLYLHHNNFSGSIPPALASSPLLQSCDLSYNLLSGPIPPDLGAAPKLFFLDLSHNNLSSSLPSSVFSFPSLRILHLHHNSLQGPPFPPSLTSPSSLLQFLDLSHNLFSGLLSTSSISAIASASTNLSSLDLSHNLLSGPLPPQLSNLSSLRFLDLSFNSFNASLPSSLSLLLFLTSFNCSYNNLTGPVPNFVHPFNASSFLGNPGLCGYDASAACTSDSPPPNQVVNSSPSSMPSSTKKRRFSTAVFVVIVAGSAVAGLLMLSLLLAVCCLLCCRGREREQGREAGEEEEEKVSAGGGGVEKSSSSYSKEGTESGGAGGGKLVHFDAAAPGFTADALLCATAEVVGKSTYGTVYKATFEDGSQVAVKRLREGIVMKGQREFEAEVNALAKLRHPNLLHLRSYYWGPKDEKLLIYDFMSGGSLSSIMHARGPETVLDWKIRLNIATAVARGLDYLHNVEKTVHGNLTSSNILLDSRMMSAKLSDFGLARLMTTAANASVIATASALGYRAPELTKLRKATSRSDVYSFGVVLLELLTGKSPSAAEQMAGMGLPEWVASIVKEEWSSEIFDLDLMKGSPPPLEDDLVRILQVALTCVDPSPTLRPPIEHVLRHLQALLPPSSSAAAATTSFL